MGKQVLQGKLNLTNISFPIQCMQARSILQAVASIAALNPSYMTTAASHPEPAERMKLVMAWSIAHLNVVHSFEKPLNPILGETFVARLDDGTMVYVEQTSHHPPISHAQIVGPDECYTMNLHTGFSAKAGMNSVQLVVVGWKEIVFRDGSTIRWNNPGDMYYHTLIGTMYHHVDGGLVFRDEKNGLEGEIGFGSGGKGMPQDYFSGKIVDKGGK